MVKTNAHILEDFKLFIQTVTNPKSNPKLLYSTTLVRTSLHLLDNLPAAREIVFEYFALVADMAIQGYVANANVDPQTGLPMKSKGSSNATGTEDETFMDIQEALENLLTKGPPAWAPVIASWSLNVVATLSDKYTKRNMSIGASCNFWLNSTTMRGLLTLISICFRKLNNIEAESLVERLLAAYQRYALTFDWVVARLGGCFPLKIISQILQCSLKRFAEDIHCRFDSEIGILEYLSFAHEQELKTTLREMLQEGFSPKKSLFVSIVPFLVVITNYSDVLLQILVNVFLEMYNDDVRLTILQKYPLWLTNKAFADMLPSFNNLALRLRSQGTAVLIGVAQMAQQYTWCNEFLEFSLQELEQVVLNARICPLMHDLATEESKYLLWKSCLSSCVYEQQTAVRLLLIISTQHSHIYYQTLSELLRKSYITNPNGIGAVIRMIGGQIGVVEFPEIKPGLRMVLEDVLLQEQFQNCRHEGSGGTSEALNVFNNLISLTKMQKKNYFPYIKQHLLESALNDCLSKILQILEVTVTKLVLHIDREAACGEFVLTSHGVKDVACGSQTAKRKRTATCGVLEEDASEKHNERLVLAHAVVELLNAIDAGARSNVLGTTEILKLAVLSVKYFFISLTEKNATVRCAAVNRSFVLLQRQCSSRKAAQAACLRELIEGALFYYGYLFGHYEDPEIDQLEIPEQEFVFTQNQQHSFGPNTNRTVLHAGVIGRGLRPETNTAGVGCDVEIQTLFLKALDSCCTDVDKQNVIDGYTMISLLLIELVSTDVMYNGLPFPDEEFTKVTMERDLLIRRAFLTAPILWGILGFIATHRPALCYSSVLLRAMCATCLHQWRAKNVSKLQPLNQNDELMQCTRKLLEILAMGQLLPPPLSNLHMIIQHFEPPEIALLLKECVWNYLKDHVPSPALFHIDNNGLHWRNASLAKIPPQYVDTLRNLMQKKLPKLGQHYHQMFIMPEMIAPSNVICTEEPNVTSSETQQ